MAKCVAIFCFDSIISALMFVCRKYICLTWIEVYCNFDGSVKNVYTTERFVCDVAFEAKKLFYNGHHLALSAVLSLFCYTCPCSCFLSFKQCYSNIYRASYLL